MTSIPALPALGARVLAFHPVARAWRPATVRSVTPPSSLLVAFTYYADSEAAGEVATSEHTVAWPDEAEALDPHADIMSGDEAEPLANAWRAILFSLTLADPRIYGERRAAAHLDAEVQAFSPRDLYALFVAAMLDADARIPGGAALFVRLRAACRDFDPYAMARMTPASEEVATTARVMPSPIRARALFANARTFVELEEKHGGFCKWLAGEPDPVTAICRTFDRVEPRAAVLFLRYAGSGVIAPDEALRRVARRLGFVGGDASAVEVRAAYEELAGAIGDAPALVDLTIRRFADVICMPDPKCLRCAVLACPARQAESAVPLPE